MTGLRRLGGWRPGLRLAVLVGSGLVVIALALAIAVSAADNLRAAATTAAIHNAEAIVRGYVDPILSASDLQLNSSQRPGVVEQLERLVISGDMRRINIWTATGRVIYSTDDGVQDRVLGIDHELAEAFAGRSVAEFGTASADEAAVASLPSQFLEIYVPIRGMTDAAPIGVFEVYQDARPIEERVDATRADVFLLALAAGVLLLGLLWLAFGGASRRMAIQNRRLTQLNEQLNELAGSLRQREARFRSLVQNSSDVVAVLDDGRRVTYESDAVRRVMGWEPAARRGQSFVEPVHPDDVAWFETFATGLAAAEGSLQPGEFRMRHADGSWRWIDAVGVNLAGDPAVGGVVLNYRDVTERKRLEDQLQHQAFHDPLTGLANRALFADRVTHALARRSRDADDQLAVLFLDLDDFKLVNDSLGHMAGDGLLEAVAGRIRASLRRQDTPARLGGDEFGILLEDADREVAGQVAERILEALRQPCTVADRQLVVQASIGIALGSDHEREGTGGTAEELLRNADAAMYTAKSRGKGRYQYYEEQMHAAALRRLELRERMERALAAGEFELRYQPVVELASGEMVGVEALARWRQPDGSLLLPAEFIPHAEETGLIIPLGRWVLEESVRQADAWHRAAPHRPFSMAVNVSSRQLSDAGFIDFVAGTLARASLAAGDLVLELTESALLEVGESTSGAIGGLKSLGVRISLDDFGTGYSSLSHLRQFPIDALKIDRSFVAGIDSNEQNERALVRSVIRLAHSIGLETIAEGVETRDQLVRLRALGAQLGQGYYFGQPMKAAELTAILRQPHLLVG
jgi:diguanylate cyclase (GGDEF)-like protein/PAS domain S-box-containing protein